MTDANLENSGKGITIKCDDGDMAMSSNKVYQEDVINLENIKKETEFVGCDNNIVMNINHINLIPDRIKEEPFDTADYVDSNMIKERLAVSNNSIEDNDKVVIQESILLKNIIKVESYLSCYCSNCGEYMEGYCVKCPALACIFDSCALFRQTHISEESVPRNLLNINFGVYALKTIPQDVRFGPFPVLDTIPSTSGSIWKVRGGKLILDSQKSAYGNWMQHVNCAKDITEHNLIVIQCRDNLYYETSRQIDCGEQLLVWFGKEHVYNMDNSIETYLYPETGKTIGKIYACTYCCLGFTSTAYLADHKKLCLNKGNLNSSDEDLICCPFCKVYVDEEEYMEFHLYYCCERYARHYRLNIRLSKMNDREKQIERNKVEHLEFENEDKQPDSNSDHSDCEIVEDGKRFKCPLCNYGTNAIFYLRSHVAIHESTVDRFSCLTCGRWYTRHYNLRVHVQVTHLGFDERRYKCVKCEFSTRHERYLECHTRTAHIDDKHYQCERCEFRTKYRRYLKHHLRLMHDNVKPRKKRSCNNVKLEMDEEEKERQKQAKMLQYECDKCSYKTFQKRNLRRHLYDHEEIKPYMCFPCGRGFKSNRDYTLHLKNKHELGAAGKEYKCEKCPYGTNRKGDLKKHMNKHEDVKQTFDCEMCGKGFASKQNLGLHTKNVHTGGGTERRCAHCKFRTRNSDELLVHLETHRLFVCKLCDKRFTARNNLRLHMRNKHVLSDEKDYKCAHCPFQTNYRRNMRYHLYTHGGERPFTCPVCDKGFTRRAEFDKHRHE